MKKSIVGLLGILFILVAAYGYYVNKLREGVEDRGGAIQRQRVQEGWTAGEALGKDFANKWEGENPFTSARAREVGRDGELSPSSLADLLVNPKSNLNTDELNNINENLTRMEKAAEHLPNREQAELRSTSEIRDLRAGPVSKDVFRSERRAYKDQLLGRLGEDRIGAYGSPAVSQEGIYPGLKDNALQLREAINEAGTPDFDENTAGNFARRGGLREGGGLAAAKEQAARLRRAADGAYHDADPIGDPVYEEADLANPGWDLEGNPLELTSPGTIGGYSEAQPFYPEAQPFYSEPQPFYEQ